MSKKALQQEIHRLTVEAAWEAASTNFKEEEGDTPHRLEWAARVAALEALAATTLAASEAAASYLVALRGDEEHKTFLRRQVAAAAAWRKVLAASEILREL